MELAHNAAGFIKAAVITPVTYDFSLKKLLEEGEKDYGKADIKG